MKIRHKIMIWVAGAGLCTSLVFSLVVFGELWEQPLEMTDSQLEYAASVVAEKLAKAQDLSVGIPETASSLSSERYWIEVYDRNLKPVYRSELARMVDLPLYQKRGRKAYMVDVNIPGRRIHRHQDHEDKVTFRVRVFTKSVAGTSYLIQIGKSVEHLEDEMFDLLAAIGIGLAVSTVLLAGLSYFLAGQIVKPIASINRLTRDINENTLETRIPLGNSRDEIYELATHLNHMFDRLQYSFARQKQFLADASHELKSPIAMLRLFFDEANQRTDIAESFRQQLDNQGRNVLRMDRLVRTLLELSILEIKASVSPKPFDLAVQIRSVAADFVPLMERENIGLESEIPDQLEIWGEKDQLRRALINLFDNAVKYNHEDGRIRLLVSETEDRIRLSLYNTGPGISKPDLPKVFDHFYRADKSRSTEYGGAGLGLAIVREIIRLHKGTVAIDSQVQSWTHVEINLPRNQTGSYLA